MTTLLNRRALAKWAALGLAVSACHGGGAFTPLYAGNSKDAHGKSKAGKGSGVKLEPGDILVADPVSKIGPAVFRVDPRTGRQSVLSSGGLLANPVSLALEGDDVLVSDVTASSGRGAIIRIKSKNGKQTILSAGGLLRSPFGIALDAEGAVWVADAEAFGGSGGVIRVDQRTGRQKAISRGGYFINPIGIAVEANGDLVVCDPDAFGDGSGGGIIRVNSETGAQTPLSWGGNFLLPYGVTVERSGALLVTDAAAFGGSRFSDGPGGVVMVDPVSGVQTVISAGGRFVDPFGIAVDAKGIVLVADLNAFGDVGGIIYFAPARPEQAVLSFGGMFGDPCGIVVVPDPGRKGHSK